MILGRDKHIHSACFDEIDEAVDLMSWTCQPQVVFNAHSFPHGIPEGAIVYNFENVGVQVTTGAYREHKVWDFSAKNCEVWKDAGRDVTHVPVGYHPSMERFTPAKVKDIDVVFSGCINERRAKVLREMEELGLNVMVTPFGVYGPERDAIIARAKLALSMQYYEGGVFPALRVAHLVANNVPVLSETNPECAFSVHQTHERNLAQAAEGLLRDISKTGGYLARKALADFKRNPLVLP